MAKTCTSCQGKVLCRGRKTRHEPMLAPNEVKVRQSRFKGAGLGLFASNDVQTGVRLPGPYRGRLLGREQLNRLRDCSYCVMLPGSNENAAAIDAKSCRRGNLLRYVNGAMTALQRRLINVKIIWRCREVHFVTIKPVRSGAEFVVDYGANYWRGLKHNARLDELQAKIREARRAVLTARGGGSATKAQRRLEEAQEELQDFLDSDEE
eukprot:TRINITY_DN8335_c0_g1_i3.p1 TRINITY_DN8335_c0_g1~~TRINITY_DN8335_c0_g1_i3.p1  ORF type:complete len:208 (+),score=33.49 TRINITY_DN8335_c0_g1_i3:84-707(+)